MAQTTQAPSGLSCSVGYALRRAQLAVFRDFLATVEHLAITPAQFSLLTLIAERPGLKQADLSDALDVKRANMVAMLDAMEARSLIVRQPAPHDARSHAVGITPAGRELLGQLEGLVAGHEARIARGLGPGGKAQLLALLGTVIGNCGGA